MAPLTSSTLSEAGFDGDVSQLEVEYWSKGAGRLISMGFESMVDGTQFGGLSI